MASELGLEALVPPAMSSLTFILPPALEDPSLPTCEAGRAALQGEAAEQSQLFIFLAASVSPGMPGAAPS